MDYVIENDLGERCKKLGIWKEYTVYEPSFIEPRIEIIGYPLFVLVDKDKNISSVRGPISLDIMDYFECD